MLVIVSLSAFSKKALLCFFSKKSDFTEEDFEWANKITHFCDRIAFNFSFGKMKEPTIDICTKVGSEITVSVTHNLDGDTITVNPWPFAVESFKGFVIAYESRDYPQSLSPFLLEYEVKKR